MHPYDQPHLDDALADAVRRAYVRPLDETAATEHMSAIVAAAATAATSAGAGSTPRRRRGWRVGLAAGAATLLLPVGLAAAGVGLPDVVERPFEAVGIELPNQPRSAPEPPAPPAARPVTPLAPVVPPTARPLGPARPAATRPQSGRGRATGRKPAAKAVPPKSQRNKTPARGARGKPAKPQATPRRTAPPRRVPVKPRVPRG